MFVASLKVTQRELDLLTRLVGHHTTGEGLDRFYEEELFLRATKSELAKGPLDPGGNKDIYGDRPMVVVP